MYDNSDFKQGNKNIEDLKIILKFQKSAEEKPVEITELYSNEATLCFLSPTISQSIENIDNKRVLDVTITIPEKIQSFQETFIALLSSVLKNEKIKYCKSNYKILVEIADVFNFTQLKKSIDRYRSYFDQLCQFNLGRLPIIDQEFLCQLYLLDLTAENMKDTKNASIIFIDEITIDTYSQILFRCIVSRLSKAEIYLQFITEEMPDYYPHFIATLNRNFRNTTFVLGLTDDIRDATCFLLRYFLEKKYVNRHDIDTFKYTNGLPSYSYQFYDFYVGNMHYSAYQYIFRNYNELSRDNFSLHRKLVFEGKNQNPLFQMIEKDDIENLQKTMAFNPLIDVNTIIEGCYYESRQVFQSNCSLIEIAAYFGSIKTFKHLLLNNATMDKQKLPLMAVYGGNAEIIRILKQRGFSFTDKYEDRNNLFIEIAIRMNHFDILRWLVEEEKDSLSYCNFSPIGYALQCSNYLAFYYLLMQKYGMNSFDDYEEDERKSQSFSIDDGDMNNDFHFDFNDYLIDLICSYNIPVLKNYLKSDNGINLLKYPSNEKMPYNRHFLTILFLNYDLNIIEPILNNFKLVGLEKIPNIRVSSLSFQKVGRFIVNCDNVSYKPFLINQLVSDLTNNSDELKNDLDFVKDQIKLFYEKSTKLSQKLILVPCLFIYNLKDTTFSKEYNEIMSMLSSCPDKNDLKISQLIFSNFIFYTNIDIVKMILPYFKISDGYNFSLSLEELIKSNKIEMFIFLITSAFPKLFSEEEFFSYFSKFENVESAQKLIHVFSEKNPDFYNKVFLPSVLFHFTKDQKEIIQYFLNLPEMKPFINIENKNYGNRPPLLFYNNHFLEYEVVSEFLINDNVDINIRQSTSNENLLWSISDDKILVEVLTNKKFEYTIDDLMHLIENMRYPGESSIFEIIINGIFHDEKHGIEINFDFNDNQLTKIFHKLAICDDRVELAKKFYARFSTRIDVNYIDPDSKSFCLFDAIDCNSVNMVEFLLNISAIDLNIRGSPGCTYTHDYIESTNVTPFMFACECGQDDIVNLFIKRKNDFDVNDTYSKNAMTVLHSAAKHNQIWLIVKLLKNFQNIDKNKLDVV